MAVTLPQFDLLLRWYDRYGRDLPWRKTRDPYAILVSEMMLQQTQVRRVLVFYDRWLKSFPDWAALAQASNAEVIRAWAGLGYNRRALMLRDIAKQVAAHGVPQNREAWLELKGIGPYTSAALAAFALKQAALPVDTNIRRVLGRVTFGRPYPQPASDDRLRRALEPSLLKQERAYDVPQAIFDLATMICTKVPQCDSCPWQEHCAAAPKFLSGRVQVPKAMVKKAKETRHAGKPYPDRIYRGRILKAAREASRGVALARLGEMIDPDFSRKNDQIWLENMVGRLEKDKFLKKVGERVFLI